MKLKTQMQYLVEELIDMAKKSDVINFNLVIGMAVVRLEKEKQQIIDAAKHGDNFDKSPFMNAEDYYKNTFEQ